MLERLAVTRVVTTPEALDRFETPAGCLVLRIAPDEALVLGEAEVVIGDAHGIVVSDAGWSGTWLDADRADAFLAQECAWRLPEVRPAFAQGMVGHMPVKLWFEASRTLFVVPHVSAIDFGALLETVR